MKATHFLFAFVCAAALFIGGGCKKSHEAGSDSITIAFVTNGVDPFWDLCAAGVRIAEKEFNIQCEVHMPTKGVVDQKRIMESLMAKGVDGIAISPIDAANQTRFLNDIAKGTKLITQDADAPDSDRIAYIGTNNYLAGRALGKLVKAAIPDGGEVFIFVGRLEQLNARQRRQGLIDELLGRPEQKLGSVKFDAEDAKNLSAEGSDYIIVETRTDDFNKAKAKSNAESAIAKHKDLKCMVGLFAYNPPACLDAIKEAGLSGKIQVCGFDEPDAMLQAIKDGTAHGTISQQPWKYGYESVKMLKGILEGNAPESTFLAIPFLVVTKDNVDEFWKTKREKMAELGKQ